MTHFSNAERKEESDFDKPVGTSNHLYSYRLHRVHRLPLRRWPALAPCPDELGIGVHKVVQLEAAVQLGLDLARRRSLALRLLLAAWNNALRRWRPWLRGNEEGRGLPARHALTPATTIDAEFHGTFRGVRAPVLTRRTRCSALCCETFGRVSGCASWDTARHGTGGAGQGHVRTYLAYHRLMRDAVKRIEPRQGFRCDSTRRTSRRRTRRRLPRMGDSASRSLLDADDRVEAAPLPGALCPNPTCTPTVRTTAAAPLPGAAGSATSTPS